MNKICVYCGKEFEGNRMYCSKRCADNASKVRRGIAPCDYMTKTCGQCGKTFETVYKLQKYCSTKCQNRASHKRNRKKALPDIKQCTVCGAEFQTINRMKQRCDACIKDNKFKKIQVIYDKRECVICNKVFVVDNRLQTKTCSSQCSKELKKLKRKERADKRIKKYQHKDSIPLQRLYERDRGVCYICGLICNWGDYQDSEGYFKAGPLYPSIEHVVPLAKGGEHSWENVRLAHIKCNLIKGVAIGRNDMTREESRRYAREIAYKKEVIQLINGVEYARYDSAAEAARTLGYKDKSIQNACRGEGTSKRNSHKMYGYEWIYAS